LARFRTRSFVINCYLGEKMLLLRVRTEDRICTYERHLLTLKIVNDVFIRPYDRRCMYHAVNNYFRMKDPDFGIRIEREALMDAEYIPRWKQEVTLTFTFQGLPSPSSCQRQH
jgi:hypothetical protein